MQTAISVHLLPHQDACPHPDPTVLFVSGVSAGRRRPFLTAPQCPLLFRLDSEVNSEGRSRPACPSCEHGASEIRATADLERLEAARPRCDRKVPAVISQSARRRKSTSPRCYANHDLAVPAPAAGASPRSASWEST